MTSTRDTADHDASARDSAAFDGQWHRLDKRTIVALAALVLVPLIPTVLIMVISGAPTNGLLITVGVWLGSAALLCALVAIDWYFTWYRVTGERFELRKGFLSRSHRSLPRDRIRSVDLTADPAHRVFGLFVVKIGTGGQSGDGELKLDSLSRSQAEELRTGLLPEGSTSDSRQDGTLARLRPAWLGYAPITLSLALVVWGAIASAFGSFSELLGKFGVYSAAAERFEGTPLWLSITAISVVVLTIGMLGATVLSTEMWWNFHLTREPGGALRVRRGLLTTRSVSLEQRRLRGVEISEPVLLRWAGGARTNAIATGLLESKETQHTERDALMPPAPRAEADRVTSAVLHCDSTPPTRAELAAHPRTALRRRLTWALASVVPIVAAAVTATALGWIPTWVAVTVPVVGLVVAIAAGIDAYRGLGHGLTPDYLVTRRGTAIRRTAALQRSGIIGWRIQQTVFQRRSGLLHVAATTAAGHGAYEVRDVAESDGLAFAEEAVPALLTPFLERTPLPEHS